LAATPPHLVVAESIARKAHESGLEIREGFVSDLGSAIEADDRLGLAWPDVWNICPRNHRRYPFRGEGNVEIEQNGPREKPDGRDGDNSDKWNGPNTGKTVKIAPEDAGALPHTQPGLQKTAPESLVDDQPGNERPQHGNGEQRNQIPTYTETAIERHQQPPVKCANELAKIKTRLFALYMAGIGIDIKRR